MKLEVLSLYLEWILTIAMATIGTLLLTTAPLLGLGYWSLAFIICPLNQAPVWLKFIAGTIGFMAL